MNNRTLTAGIKAVEDRSTYLVNLGRSLADGVFEGLITIEHNIRAVTLDNLAASGGQRPVQQVPKRIIGIYLFNAHDILDYIPIAASMEQRFLAILEGLERKSGCKDLAYNHEHHDLANRLCELPIEYHALPSGSEELYHRINLEGFFNPDGSPKLGSL